MVILSLKRKPMKNGTTHQKLGELLGAFMRTILYKERNFGKLYNWHALNDPREIVPPGYRIPNEDDWITLENDISIKDKIGSKLKHEYGWFENGSGNNYSGFSALPGGFRSPAGFFYLAEKNAYWWSISEYDSNNSFYRFLSYSNNIIVKHHFNKGSGFSVRFIKE
jgi:uncharacterized protein (TIGR02145 family)